MGSLTDLAEESGADHAAADFHFAPPSFQSQRVDNAAPTIDRHVPIYPNYTEICRQYAFFCITLFRLNFFVSKSTLSNQY